MAIVSFQHRFIFVKTAKTAGTSIEIALDRIAGEDAIVTPISPPVPGHRPRNYRDESGRQLFYNHMPAALIREQLGPWAFGSMLSFCVEREPVEKCISDFHMLRNSALHNPDGSYRKSWAEYVADGKFPINLRAYTEIRNGKRELMVNRVLRYDQLSWALPALMEELGIPHFRLTSRAKSEYSRNRLISPADVTETERRRIYDAFRQTCKVTNIDWNSPCAPSTRPGP